MRRATLASFAASTYPLPPRGGGSSTPSTMFVYRPGAVNPQRPVFNDWPTLMAAVGLAAGPKLIQIDDSIISPAVIPSSAGAPGGVWDLHNCTLVGTLSNPRVDPGPTFNPSVHAQCANGCVFANLVEIFSNLSLTTVSTAPVYTLPAGGVVFLDTGATLDAGPGAAPFLFAPGPYPANNGPVIVLGIGSNFGTTPGQHVLDSTDVTPGDGNVIIIFASPFPTSMPNDVLTGPGMVFLLFVNAGTLTTWPNPPGLPPVQPSANIVIDDATSTKNLASYWCTTTDPADLVGPWIIPFGYSLVSVPTTNPVSMFLVEQGLITRFILSAGGTGNPGDAVKTLTFKLQTQSGGGPWTDVPGAVITSGTGSYPDPSVGGFGNAQFAAGYVPGLLRLIVEASAPLLAPVPTIISGAS